MAFQVPEAIHRLVFVDGHYCAALSQVSQLPVGVTLGAIDADLGALAPFEDDAFVALNTRFLRDVASVDVAVQCPDPIHLLFVSTRPDAVSCPRVFLRVRGDASASFIEDHVSVHTAGALVNAVTEIDAMACARVTHLKIQRQPDNQFHIGHLSARLGRDAQLVSQCVTLGARLSRQDLRFTQQGEGAQCRIEGLALLKGRQHADTHTTMVHAKPHGKSEQVHRCIVDGAARAVFNGRILVRPHAQRTDAAQQSKNLLLTERARVDTKPQLEIHADDVKCSHGATVGQLDDEELFYLRTRGIGQDTARALLTYGFAAEVIERISIASLVDQLRKEVMQRISGGQA